MPTKYLTDEAVKAAKLPANKDRLEIYDRECPGLVLRVGATAKNWMFYHRHGGRFTKETIGNAHAIKLAKAREAARRMRDRTLAGADPRGAAGADTPETFEQLARLWLDKHSKVHRKSSADDEMLLRLHATPKLGEKRLIMIDGPTVARLHSTTMEQQRTRETARAAKLNRMPRANAGGRIADRVIDLVKAIFRWGVHTATRLHGWRSNHGSAQGGQ